MDNKKVFLAVILAAIVALIIAFVFLKCTSKTIPIKLEEDKLPAQEDVAIPTDEENVVKTEEEPVQKTIETEVKPATKPVVKKVVKPTVKPAEVPVIKPLQVEEKKSMVNSTEEKADAGIIKDSTTNDIVITKEFKSNTPSKYSFEGYGVQKAPTK